MVAFATNGTFTANTVSTNRWWESGLPAGLQSTSLAGKRGYVSTTNLLEPSGSDTALVAGSGNQVIAYDMWLGAGLQLNGSSQRFSSSFTEFDLGSGNDVLDLTVSPTRGVPVYSTNVEVIGGAGDDVIWSGAGSDDIYGDEVYSGILTVVAGAGADIIDGGDGSDFIVGDHFFDSELVSINLPLLAAASDTIHGGNGDDVIIGDVHWDNSGSLVGVNVSVLNSASDEIYGGGGNDTIYGDSESIGVSLSVLGLPLVGFNSALNFGDDYLNGGDGNDTIHGDIGGVSILSVPAVGGALSLNFGDDTIEGGQGDDILYGDMAPGIIDDLLGDLGSRLSLSFGNDTFVFKGNNTGNDIIKDFNVNQDTIRIEDVVGVDDVGDLNIANNGNGDAVATLSAGNTIIFEGVNAASLLANPQVFDIA